MLLDKHRKPGVASRWPDTVMARMMTQKKADSPSVAIAEFEVRVRQVAARAFSADYVSRVESALEMGSRIGDTYEEAIMSSVHPWVVRVVQVLRGLQDSSPAALPPLPPLPPWLQTAHQARDELTVRRAFGLLFDDIQHLLNTEEYGALSDLLQQLADHATEIDPVLCVAGLRLTWRARGSLAAWPRALERISRALSNTGYDAASALAGLYDT